jgi:hypothetical protein
MEAMAEAADSSVRGSDAYERLEYRLELVAAVLLGLAATVTAWAAFQGGQYDGEMLTSFTEANLNLSDANQYYSEGTQEWIQDEQLFLEYATAITEGNEDLAFYLRESLMRDELVAAIEWWEEQPTDEYLTPFVEENPNWVIPAYGLADELAVATDEAFVAGEEANKTGDTYNLITVLLAASLFVLGIATTFRVLKMRIVVLAVGAGILVVSTIWMLTLPVSM